MVTGPAFVILRFIVSSALYIFDIHMTNSFTPLFIPKHFIILFIVGTILSFSTIVSAQTASSQTSVIDSNQIYTAVEVEPRPFGGLPEFYQFLSNNLRYPPKDLRNNIHGKVFVQFVVEKTGRLIDFKIIKAPSNTIADETLRVLKISPRWLPGIQNGHPVHVQYTIPITFNLDHESGLKKEFSELDNYLRANLKYPENASVGIVVAELSINDGHISKDINFIEKVSGLDRFVKNTLKNYENKLDVPSGKYLIAFHFCTRQQTPDEKLIFKLRTYDNFLGDIYVVDAK